MLKEKESLDLESKLDNAFSYLGISKEQKSSLRYYLNIIKERDVETYEHSVRVGLLGVTVADYLNLDSHAFFYSGLLHDVGKPFIKSGILTKKEKFTEEDMEEMKKHTIYGYLFVKNVHPFSAEMIIRHHKYNDEPYPEKLPDSEFSEKTNKLIDTYSKILSMIDFYDAISTRDYGKYSECGKIPSFEEIKNILLEKYPDLTESIKKLYEANIFGADSENPDKNA